MQVLDAVVTVLLFVVLLAWVWMSLAVGTSAVMLSDSGTPGVAWLGVALAVVGVPATVIAAYVTAVVLALRTDGVTFHLPLLALVVGTLAAVVVYALGLGIVVVNVRVFGTDEERRRRTVPTEPTGPTASPPTFTYTASHRIDDGSLHLEVGVEQHTGRRYLRTPMPQRDGEYREYFGIDIAMYTTFGAEPDAARRFAAQCRAGQHADRWLPPAGFPGLTPIPRDGTRLARKLVTVLTDRPTTADGAPVGGLPPGTPFVRIVDDAVDERGDVGVRLPGTTGEVVRIAAHHLGRG
ncbi:hypothetical protein PSU4_43930 [Pseudonocardia sulfidoxydans NBRC 16205]|uniref:Uncharacterized protein n=1 Tax=Pseudonocardia sulfidoxydans NBRC 16205 TaxID=1223511 RepID=A0A511DKT8_9PSEU|nr:hypothetical protein [Pseudonocardia sulfidoxydans]GEL25439.1 hypothetical protein PSU4_43930 [Pseudonocardia sulfidoxydans NBRC 16205]